MSFEKNSRENKNCSSQLKSWITSMPVSYQSKTGRYSKRWQKINEMTIEVFIYSINLTGISSSWLDLCLSRFVIYLESLSFAVYSKQNE